MLLYSRKQYHFTKPLYLLPATQYFRSRTRTYSSTNWSIIQPTRSSPKPNTQLLVDQPISFLSNSSPRLIIPRLSLSFNYHSIFGVNNSVNQTSYHRYLCISLNATETKFLAIQNFGSQFTLNQHITVI